jgi:hypothetical protein
MEGEEIIFTETQMPEAEERLVSVHNRNKEPQTTDY